MLIRDQILGEIKGESGVKAAEEASRLLKEIIEGDSESPGKFLSAASRLIAAGHLSSPETFKNNILYSFTTDIPTYGFNNVRKGIHGLLRHPLRSVMGARGAGQIEVGAKELQSLTFEKGMGEVITYLGGIKQSEIINRAKSVISAGATAKAHIDFMSKRMSDEQISYLGRKKLERGTIFFQEFGGFTNAEIATMVKRGYMKEKEIDRVQSIAPSLTQGSVHPLFMNKLRSGSMAPFASLYKMSYRSTAGVHKSVIKPMINGDIVPLLRWAAGTGLAGELQYAFNEFAFGWENPAGGTLDNFLEYLHGEDTPKEKFYASVYRLSSNIAKAQGYGILSDTFRGYGMLPVAVEATINAQSEIGYILSGKKEFLQSFEDIGRSQLAIFRSAEKLKKANLNPRSKEYRTYGKVRSYVRRDKDTDSSFNFSMGENTYAQEAIREAYWEGNVDVMRKTLASSIESMTQRGIALEVNNNETFELDEIKAQIKTMMSGKNPKSEEDARAVILNNLDKKHRKIATDTAKATIKGMSPLKGIKGGLTVKVGVHDTGGDKFKVLKNGKISTESLGFWQKLTPKEQETVINSVDDYIKIIQELNLLEVFQ